MPISLLRLPVVQSRTGKSRTSVYNAIKEGTLPKPVHIGSRAVRWPSYEIDAVVRAVIAGKTDDEIRELVKELVAQRTAGEVAQ